MNVLHTPVATVCVWGRAACVFWGWFLKGSGNVNVGLLRADLGEFLSVYCVLQTYMQSIILVYSTNTSKALTCASARSCAILL